MQSDIVVSNHIINMYAKCGNISSARLLFDGMLEKNLVSWSAIISGYDQAEEPLMAIDMFSRLRLVPNEYIFASTISSCASILSLIQGQQIHAQILKFGYVSSPFVVNSLISMYMKCGSCSDAMTVFSSGLEPNVVSYNALITGFVENQQHESGFEVFKLISQRGLIPDCFTFVGLFKICATRSDVRRGLEIHGLTIKLNLDHIPSVGNVVITMYSKFDAVESAEKAFRLIEEKDIISWNTIIAACSHCDDHAKGLELFKEMIEDVSVGPDEFTFSSALAACAGLASVQYGKQIHSHLVRTRLHQDVGVSNSLINMYAKCGCIGYAYDVFNKIVHRNLVSWNTIIVGFGNHGLGQRALDLFEQMKIEGAKPDSATFMGVLTACNHAGLVDEGQQHFNFMNDLYGITPDLEHFSCLIDLLGRAGRLKVAEKYMMKFSFGRDPIVLGSLLSACRLHGEVEIGERFANRLLNYQPVTTSPFVLLSNLYASDGMWHGVAEARKMLKGSGLKKEPGHSLIEVKGFVEKFIVGSFSHSRIEEIKETLKSLNWAVCEISSRHQFIQMNKR